jgi:hypothetical protein
MKGTSHSKPQRKLRRRVLLACEGDSEQGYGKFLGIALSETGCNVHIETLCLSGGNPLKLVQGVREHIQKKNKTREPYKVKALLLDTEWDGEDLSEEEETIKIAKTIGLILIWQRPSHEAFLLRHFSGCEMLQPPTSKKAMERLKKEWPDYRKGYAGTMLREKLDIQSIRRAATVEPGFDNFLKALPVIG